MKLIKTRPKIRLTLPECAHPGERVIAEVTVEAKRDVAVDFVHCTLTGVQRSSWGSGEGWRSYRVPVVALRAQPSGPTELKRGATRFSCVFDLPLDLPPSYRGARADIAYTVEVVVSVPWWPDAKERFVLVVRPRPERAPGKGRSLHSTEPDGPVGDAPHIEFALEETRLLPGDTLRGEFALANVARNRYRTAQLSVLGTETIADTTGRVLGTRSPLRYTVEIPVETAAEGEPIPFAMKLPDQIPPTFAALVTQLTYDFEIEVKLAWGKKLAARVPVRVLPAESIRTRPKVGRAAFAVGTQRIISVWREVADKHGLRFDEEANTLLGMSGDASFEILRAHRDGDGIFVVGRIAYPSLHLAIDGGRSTGLRRIFDRGFSVGDEGWDTRHFLAGREQRQVRAFMGALVYALRNLRLADVSDEEIVVELRRAGSARESLARFVASVMEVATAVEHGRRAIPIPAKMKGTQQSWQRLAKRLGGTLEKARMATSGRYEGAQIQVATEWTVDGAALHTDIVLDTETAIADKYALTWSEGSYLTGSTAELSKRARALVQDLTDGALSLTIATRRIALWDRAPVHDTRAILKRLDQLVALARALGAQQGPYR